MADLVIKPTSGNLVFKDDQNVARATIATSSGATTLSGNVTMSGTANNLGTVTAGNLSNNAIVMPRFKEFDVFFNANSYLSTTSSQTINISGSEYLTFTPDATGDILEFGWFFNMYIANGYVGFGIERDDNTSFSSPTVTWDTGQHSLSGIESDNYFLVGGVHHETCAGLTTGTPYYYRLKARTHSATVSANFGEPSTYPVNGDGIRFTGKRWSIA